MNKELFKLNELKQTLTGIRKKDRLTLFDYLISLDIDTDKSHYLETLRYAVSYLPNNVEEMDDEIEKNEHIYIPALIHIGRALDLNIYRRVAIFTYLGRIMSKKDLELREDKDILYFDVTDKLEQKMLIKLINGAKIEFVENAYFTDVFLFAGLTLLEYGDQQAAFNMLLKANQWNPVCPDIIRSLLIIFKKARQSGELIKMGMWLNRISYDTFDIALAMQFVGYGLYLDGKFEEAYAFYFQSLKYNPNSFPGLNEEIVSVLSSLGKTEPYTLTKRQLKDLFLGKNYFPVAFETTFETLRLYIIELFKNEEYIQVLDHASAYLKVRPSDEKIKNIYNKASYLLD